MWIPGGIAYLAAALVLMAGALREHDRRPRARGVQPDLEVQWRTS
jgi:hypothetical protein